MDIEEVIEHLETALTWLRKYPVHTLVVSDKVALGLTIENMSELLAELWAEVGFDEALGEEGAGSP